MVLMGMKAHKNWINRGLDLNYLRSVSRFKEHLSIYQIKKQYDNFQ